MIVVTGAAGFIGSNLVKKLNQNRFYDLVLVDDFSKHEKDVNLLNTKYLQKVDRTDFFNWLSPNQEHVQFIFHLGARTDTTEFNYDLLWKLNTDYSKQIWKACVDYSIPLVYASSAATYGDGTQGYVDDHEHIPYLKPLNPYGESKQAFDVWALEQEQKPFFWAGLKFFNVYGFGEAHKQRMASVVFHAYHQIKKTERMKLFKSHKPEYHDGEQLRDFVYVEDVVNVCIFLMHLRKHSGIYNLGSGQARTFKDLALAVFKAMNVPPHIEYIDTPIDIRDKYQYFTEANMQKLTNIGYNTHFHTLEEGVTEYIEQLKKS